MGMTHYSLKNRKYLSLSIIIIMLVWQVIAIIVDNRLLLPSFFDVLRNILGISQQKYFLKIIISSGLRCIYSFLIALIIAIILGWISYYSRIIYNFILPIISFIKSVPTMALIVLLLIWTSKDISPILIGIIIALPTLYEIILNSLINIDIGIIEVCKVYRINKFYKIKDIFMPTILIEVSKIVNSMLSLVFKVVISAEVYAQPQYGIGTMIQWEKMQLDTGRIVSWMIIVTIISYFFDFIIEKVIKKIEGIGRYTNAI